jgi:hypothetical protein
MSALELVFALEYRMAFWGIFLAIVLAAGLWIPYLYKEIRRGKAQLGPRTPIGAGDVTPGRPGNPAPGKPDAQADPYEPRASR